MHTIIGWAAKLGFLDDLIPGNGSKTIIAACILFAAWVGNQLPGEYVSDANFLLVAKVIGGAFGVTLAVKIPREARKALAPLLLVFLLSACTFSLGPDGRYAHGELDPGVCLAANAGEYLSAGFGFCTEDGASTEVLEGADVEVVVEEPEGP